MREKIEMKKARKLLSKLALSDPIPGKKYIKKRNTPNKSHSPFEDIFDIFNKDFIKTVCEKCGNYFELKLKLPSRCKACKDSSSNLAKQKI